MKPPAVTVRHNFETAHRLPHLGGKCQNLHGHSWWAHVTVEGAMQDDGTVVEFGDLKRELRGWIDAHLDHAAMLGAHDLLVGALHAAKSKLFVFGEGPFSDDLEWPTVENVATLIARVAGRAAQIVGHPDRDLTVTQVEIRETHINSAVWAL